MGKLAEATAAANAMNRGALIAKLRRVAARHDRPLDSRDLSGAMLRAVRRRFGSIAAARRAADLPQPPGKRRWGQAEVVAEVRRLWVSGVTITVRQLDAIGRKDLIAAIEKYAGGVVRARRLAKVPDPPPRLVEYERWDDERVTAEILARHRDGEPLASSKVTPRLFSAGLRYYGSWRNAVEAAGLDYDAIRLQHAPYTPRELLAMLRALAAKRPAMTRAELVALSWRAALVHQFGSIDEALRRARIRDWPRRLRDPALARRQVIAALRSRRRTGKPTYWSAVQHDDSNLWYSGMLHFGDWERAIAAAGLATDAPQQRWSRDAIVDALRARLARGASLKPASILRDAPDVYYSALTYFDSYLDAVRTVGDAPWALTKWTPVLIGKELRRRAGRRRQLSVRDAGNRVVSAARHHFGSFHAACRAAGVVAVRAELPARR